MSGRGKMTYAVVTVAAGIVCMICFAFAAVIYLVVNICELISAFFRKN